MKQGCLIVPAKFCAVTNLFGESQREIFF